MRRKTLQTNFSAGEIAPEFVMRLDADQRQNGAKSLRNMRCLISGGVTRRPGTRYRAEFAARRRIKKWVVDSSTRFLLAFGDGTVDFYNLDGSSAGAGLTGCPWTGSIYLEMDYVQRGNVAVLSHADMQTQTIGRSGGWERANFFFQVGPAGRPEQPYLKLSPTSVAIAPSGLTGDILISSTAAVFTTGYENTYIRYLGKACLITQLVNSQTVAATVVESLPPTQILTVDSSARFAVGEVIEGDTTGAKGQVTAIADGTHITAVIVEGLTKFDVEALTGPNGVAAISAVSDTTPADTVDWDVQLFSPVWGYPSCAAFHRNRLLFGGHPAAPSYLIGSAINNLRDFNADDGSDADGFIESIGDAGASKIVGLHSSEQLLVLTDRGPYYVPEGPTAPFRPSSIAFFGFGSPWPFTEGVRPVAFDGGVIGLSRSLVVKMRPTGNLSSAWDASEVSILSSHLVSSPDDVAVTSNFDDGPERYAVIRNDDGTLAVMQLVEEQRIRNFTPWDTDGQVLSLDAIDDQIFLSTSRVIDERTRYFLEEMDQELTLDLVTEYTDLDDVPDRYDEAAVNVRVGNYHLGTYPLEITNPPAGPYEVGFLYTPTIELMPPIVEDPSGPAAGQYMRIVEALVHVISSARFATNGLTLQAYQVTTDVQAAPPLRNGVVEPFQFLGWERDPTLTITQADPLPLTVLSVKTEVAW